MASTEPMPPVFGQADLSNCEREQIHLAGSIQPHGVLLVIDEQDWTVLGASANAAAMLRLPQDPVGAALTALPSDLATRVAAVLPEALDVLPVAVRCTFGASRQAFVGLVHRPPGAGLVIELERAGPPNDFSGDIRRAVQSILLTSSLRGLCDETARIFKDLTGYDRVMVYRFDDEGHGEVFAEQREPELEAFLGNHYPASDIPQIARRLYERNRVRVLVDVLYAPVPIVTLATRPQDALDMSLCGLRSMSPIHVQYLRNMGVAATLVASLMVGGKLWGLIACHHYVPRVAHFEMRAVCELLAEAVATRLAALESFAQGQAEMSVRRLEQRLVEAISREGDWRSALFDSAQSLLQPLGASGVALLFEGQTQTAGEVPGTQQLREIGDWLDGLPHTSVFDTASLGRDQPGFAPLAGVASGVLAAPVSNSGGEYLVWFRPEQVRTVTWGGNPFKPVQIGDDPRSLSPRRSFSQWHQLVEGTSEPWTQPDRRAARMIGETVSDVVLQFRTVRLLIAQDQLDAVRRQVRQSDQPAIVIDPGGRILMVNEAFGRLLPAAANGADLARPRPDLARIDDLPAFFEDPVAFADRMRDLLHLQRLWRGEVRLRAGSVNASGRPLMVRADPVFAAPSRLLGFVLLFTDLTGHKTAEAARQRFQEGIIKGPQMLARRLDSQNDLLFQKLLSAVVENAQLAALEITEGVDLDHVAEMLEGVRLSVARTSEMLQLLIWHISNKDGGA